MQVDRFFPDAIAFRTDTGMIYTVRTAGGRAPRIVDAILELADAEPSNDRFCLVGEVRNHYSLSDFAIIKTAPITHYYTVYGELKAIDPRKLAVAYKGCLQTPARKRG